MKITRLTTPPPADVIPFDVIAEYVGLDGDLDASQDKVLPVLKLAAIDFGEEITGIVWRETGYRVEAGACGGLFYLPVLPVFAMPSIVATDADGVETTVPESAYSFTPSAFEFGTAWASITPLDGWPGNAVSMAITTKAGWAANTFPDSLRSWALIRIASLYDVRDDVIAGAVAAAPRDHARALLDRYTVRNNPYVCG